MFGPTASPVVQAQSTWHIGPTTCVLTSRRRAWRESDGSADSVSQLCIAGNSDSTQRESVTASLVSVQTKHDARVILSASTWVRIVSAAVEPRVIESVRLPSV